MTLTPPPSQQTPNSPHRTPNRRVLIVESYCHDVLNQNGTVVAETLGGAASSISNVLDSSFFSCDLISNRRVLFLGQVVTGIAQPSGSDKLYTVSTDETLRIWDCASGHVSICLPLRVHSIVWLFFDGNLSLFGTFFYVPLETFVGLDLD
ncbi:hypothetical protein Bca52824_049383 [Brassica carinata]|uniref:Uncharacterized protein n=1 Tax=Brassica carinata TaxID=52824 RepID=A0A8X7RQB7_BRACI|nr:hypothetical protein Bca52824_049383 [Brassica carinata]